MPKEPTLLGRYSTQYTNHRYDPFCPETFDPTSINLPGSADRVSVDEDGPGSAPSAILLGENMRGKYFNRDMPVFDNGHESLLGYSLADPERRLIEGRDRSAMNPKLMRLALDKLLCAGIEKSARLRRELVMKLTQGCSWDRYEDIRVEKLSARAIELIQQESSIMFEGTILLSGRASLRTTMIAKFRDLKPQSCHPALDEGKTLVDDFVEELRSLPREEIGGQDGAASGWASMVRGELLQLTGATSFASVEFPGKLGSKHVVWVEKDVVLVSRMSLKVDLKREDYKTAKFLLDIISCSMEPESRFATQSELPFQVYHLITSAEHCPQESPLAVVMNGASDAPNGLSPSDAGAQGLPAGDGENAGPEVAPNRAISAPAPAAAIANGQGKSEAMVEESGPAGDGENAGPQVAPNRALSAPAAAAATIADDGQGNPETTVEESGPAGGGENAGSEVSPNGAFSTPAAAAAIAEEQATPEATAEVGCDESDGIDGDGMEEGEPRDTEERSRCGGKRVCDTAEGEAAAKRNKQHASESEGGGSGSGVAPPVLTQVAPVAENVAGMPTVSVKVEESSSSEGGVVAPVQPHRSDEPVLERLGVSQEAEVGEVDPSVQPPPPPAPIPAAARNGEELGAFLFEGDFVPALIHVERHAMGREDGSIDLYRIAGRKDNEAEVSARFSAVVTSERARRVLESAVKKPGVDISLFCWDEPDALAAFVGQDNGRIFVNLHHGSKPVDEWAVDDLPTHVASAMAHLRSATPANVRSHAWSVELGDG